MDIHIGSAASGLIQYSSLKMSVLKLFSVVSVCIPAPLHLSTAHCKALLATATAAFDAQLYPVQRDTQMEESEASTSQCLVPSPVRPGQEVLPHVSRRVLEYANHLAKNRSEVARDMLRLRVPTPDQLARHTAALQVILACTCDPACTCTHEQAGLQGGTTGRAFS